MSQENVEIVRRIYEAFLRSDWDQPAQLDAALARLAELFDPDVELHGTVGGLSEGSVARGLQRIRQEFEQWDAEAWDESRLEPERFIDGGNRVVVLQHEFRRGKGSGVELETDTAVVFEVRDGRVTRIQGYMDRASALEAAGLGE
jgi:ketosteroid isomerase-like protein